MTESPTNQSKALQLLKAIYDKTRSSTEPVFISEIDAGLFWRCPAEGIPLLSDAMGKNFEEAMRNTLAVGAALWAGVLPSAAIQT